MSEPTKRHAVKVSRQPGYEYWQATCWCGWDEDFSSRAEARKEKAGHESRHNRRADR